MSAVTSLTLDVTDAAQTRGAVEKVDSLDLLINNAGLQPFDDLSDRSVLERTLAINLLGPYDMIRAFLPLLTRSRGAVVNNVSLSALAPVPLAPAYSISKAAAFSLTRSLRVLLAGRGVRVHAVLAGPIDTEMTQDQDMEADMTTTTPRALISAMQVTLDGYILGPKDEVDWVDSWADGLELLPPVDAFVLGGGMFPRYEQFWTAILDDPSAASDMLGRDPYPREIAYARAAAETPHLVLSNTLIDVSWPTAQIVHDIDEIGALRQQPGKAVYVVGGPGLLNSLIHAGLIDELHLIVHSVVVGDGTALFGGIPERRAFELMSAEPMASGRVHLTYRPAADAAER